MKNNIMKLFSRMAMIAILGMLSGATVWGQSYEELYSADFTSVATHSYTQNKTFTLSGKSWTASVSQVNGGVFYLGCNSNNAAKGILNNNSTFSSVVTALCDADATYNSNKTTAHAYALLFENLYSSVTKVSFGWAGGNNAFQVYLFGDSGSGYVLLGHTNYASSGAAVAGSVEWTGDATNYSKFAIVARPGATNSTATNKTLRAATFTIFKSSGSSTPTCAEPTFSPEEGKFPAAQSVTISTTTQGASIYYTTDGSTPTTSSNLYTSAINVSTTTTIKAIAVKDDYENSPVASATYTIVSFDHAGTQADPYSVADARKAIDEGVGVENVYATGIVSAIPYAYSSTNNNISFNFVDEVGNSVFLQAYKCVGTEVADVRIGDVVVVYGNLTKYNTTYEFAQNCQLVSLTHPVIPSITVTPSTVNVDAAGADGIITVAYNNITEVVADVAFFASDGTTAATYDWITVDIDSDNNVDYLIDANTSSAARNAYMKVWAYDDNLNAVYSDLITFTQAGYVSDTAELPFEFDGGRGDIASTPGLTQSGLGTDYASSPKLKFDSSDDYLVLKIGERPGKLTFDIKGNSFSGGTFKLQASEDGETYTDIKSYNSLGDTETEEIKDLASTVRYIKWIYTNKSSGNVAIGNITLAEYVAPEEFTLSVESLSHVNLFIFGGDESETIINTEDGQSTAQVLSGTNVEISVDVEAGYVLESLMVGGEDVTSQIVDDLYAFEMPTQNVTISATAVKDVPPVPSNWVLTTLAELTANDVFVIVGNDGNTFAMANDNGTTSAAAAVAVTVSGNSLSGDIADNIQWNISGNATDGYVFYPNGVTDNWLYITASNAKCLVGTNANKTFILDPDNGYLKNQATGKYIGIYNSSDWRGYSPLHDNIAGQTFAFYKKEVPSAPTVLNAVLGDGVYWATFFDASASYTLSEGAKAFTMNASNELYQLGEGDVIPANTAVVILSDVPTVTLTTNEDNVTISAVGGGNILQGSNTPVSTVSGTPYVLGIVGGQLGFYEFTGDSIPAYKAYYVVNNND